MPQYKTSQTTDRQTTHCAKGTTDSTVGQKPRQALFYMAISISHLSALEWDGRCWQEQLAFSISFYARKWECWDNCVFFLILFCGSHWVLSLSLFDGRKGMPIKCVLQIPAISPGVPEYFGISLLSPSPLSNTQCHVKTLNLLTGTKEVGFDAT